MTIDRETLMAYADGELDELTRRRVEQAITADPALAAQVEADRALRARIAGHYAEVAEQPNAPGWVARGARAAAAAGDAIDLGLLGPGGFRNNAFRGWSGGNKNRFTVSATDATPSYVVGPIAPGRWNLLLGIPNIREKAHSEYTAKVYFSRNGKIPHLLEKPKFLGV